MEMHWGTDSVLGLLFIALAYFVKTTLRSNQEKHVAHYKHAADLKLHETDRDREGTTRQFESLNELISRHVIEDDRRFNRTEKQLDEIGTDIKLILRQMGDRND